MLWHYRVFFSFWIDFILFFFDYMAKNISLGLGITFDVYYRNEFLINLTTQMTGLHNVYNAMAVLASLNEAGVDLLKIKEHFCTFTGMGRRQQLSAKFDEICVYDDYAHHPTEIRATLSGLKSVPANRIIAVFQPHRYSRFSGLWDDFLRAFDDADEVYITDVYAASEAPIINASPENFASLLSNKIPCYWLSGTITDVARQLLPKLKSGDFKIKIGTSLDDVIKIIAKQK